ncbi:MAG: hypothetical protein ACRDIC_03230 [bacterium]
MSDSSTRYALGVYALGAFGVACAVLIVLGEARGGPGEGRWYWLLGGAALGMIFIVYGFILLLLRKMEMIGPRRAEAEDDLRGRWTKPVP